MELGSNNEATPGTVRRVALTCDILRFVLRGEHVQNGQLANLDWLSEMLATGVDWRNNGVELVPISPAGDFAAFRRELANDDALTEYRTDSANAWARRYDVSTLDIFPGLLDTLLNYDLVVGFEIPPSMKRLLHNNGRKYINFHIHPLRFLRDLCLGATSNSARISNILQAYSVNPEEINRQVHRLRALFVKHKPALCAIPPSLPVLVGQTEFDSVLIKDGKFQNWESFNAGIESSLRAFPEVVLLEHPERANSNSIIRFLRDSHGKTVIATNANSYGVLLTNPRIPTVLTLASSLGVEAGEFGLSPDFLLSDPRTKFVVSGVDTRSSSALGHGVLQKPFWDAVLDSVVSDCRSLADSDYFKPANDFFLGDNFIRDTLQDWSYRALRGGLQLPACRKSLALGRDCTLMRRSELIASLLMLDNEGPRSLEASTLVGSAQGINISVLPSAIALDEERYISFGSPDSGWYLAEGFHQIESWGVWNASLLSRITIPLAPMPKTETFPAMDVEISMRCYRGLLPRSPVIRIKCDERDVGFCFFRAPTADSLEVRFSTRAVGTSCTISFYSSELASPSTEANANDTRLLGFGIYSLKLKYINRTFDRTDPLQFWGLAEIPISPTINLPKHD